MKKEGERKGNDKTEEKKRNDGAQKLKKKIYGPFPFY